MSRMQYDIVMNRILIALTLIAMAAGLALAEPPAIEEVRARQDSNGAWSFHVTIRHPDTGWDHYADGWRILDMDGNELGLRVLYHPHVDEQPFTRSLSGVDIPTGTRRVQVQARDLPGGWNEETTIVELP